jgi:hypothetical protein
MIKGRCASRFVLTVQFGNIADSDEPIIENCTAQVGKMIEHVVFVKALGIDF